MFNRFKIFVFALVAGFLFLTTAGPVLAQEGVFGAYHKAAQAIGLEKDPAKDPICWQKQVCYTALKQQFPDLQLTDENWQSPGPNGRCGSDLGVCLPAGTTPLEIKIGQVTEAKDLGDYIKKIYIYLLSIGGIVAAVLLIKSGADWMLSVGESEGIKNAQATMAGALIGLLFLLGSYTLLYTINPDLVNLKLPQVYMVRPQALLDMAEGSPCWEKDVTNAACVGLGATNEYACRPIHKNGPLIDLVYSEISIIMTAAIPIPGGSAVGVKVGEWVVGGVSKAVGKYVGYFFKAPAGKLASIWGKYFPEAASKGTQLSLDFIGAAAKKDTTWVTTKKIAQAVLETAKDGKMAVAKMGVLGPAVGAGALAGSVIVPGEIYDLLYGNGEKGVPGVCEKTNKLPEGMFCNALVKSDCASGSCVKVVEWSGWVTNMEIGVCSPGGAGNPCNEESKDTDCGDKDGPFQCIENECSNGSINTTCNEDKDCKSSMKCFAAIGKKRCTNEGAVGEDVQCQKVTKTANDAGDCQKGLTCLAPPKEKSSPIGICTAGQIESPCYQNADCLVKDTTIHALVKCLGSQTVDEPYKTGKCLFLYYNSKPSNPDFANEPVLENENYTSEDVGCSEPNDCINSNCIIGGLGGEYNSCGKKTLP